NQTTHFLNSLPEAENALHGHGVYARITRAAWIVNADAATLPIEPRYEDEALDGLEAHLHEGGQLGHYNSAISRRRFRRSGATGVAVRAGRDSRESCERRRDLR